MAFQSQFQSDYGQLNAAIVKGASGGFEPHDVSLGVDAGDDVEVIKGLREGDQVVVSGQFLIDSEARLRSVLGNMATSASAPAPVAVASAEVHVGEGKVEKVAPDAITISHGPVATLQWPAMTMDFAKPDSRQFGEIKPGDRIRFEFKAAPSGYELVSIQRLSAGASK